MPNLFVDSSALVKRYRRELGSRRVSELLQDAEHLFIARLTIVEVSSSLVRRARATALPAGELAATLSAFDDEVRNSFDIVELDEPVINRAVDISRKHGLRGADAIQLACALLSYQCVTLPGGFHLVSTDLELNIAATAEGLSVENPDLNP